MNECSPHNQCTGLDCKELGQLSSGPPETTYAQYTQYHCKKQKHSRRIDIYVVLPPSGVFMLRLEHKAASPAPPYDESARDALDAVPMSPLLHEPREGAPGARL
mmetsp:Transcript_18626/g.44847  ORF Transcript_18626/g.44847 Transcript_18626/m.44847 type:complete len:104 (-) Transcript_18626:396-707(-)